MSISSNMPQFDGVVPFQGMEKSAASQKPGTASAVTAVTTTSTAKVDPNAPRSPDQITLEQTLRRTIITNTANHLALSKAIGAELRKDPAISTLIKTAEAQPEHFHSIPGRMSRSEVLQQIPWLKLKEQLGDRLQTDHAPKVKLPNGQEVQLEPGPTFQEFRQSAKELQEKVMARAEERLGFQPGTWKAFGTPGFNSDIDNTYTPHPSLNESQKMLIKVVVDAMWADICGGETGTLSGPQADLETYLIHPGASLNTAANISTVDAQATYTNMELSMGMLAMRRSNPESYQKETAALKSSVGEIFDNPDDAKALQTSFGKIAQEAEQFEKIMDEGTIAQMNKEQPSLKEATQERVKTAHDADHPISGTDAYKKACLFYKSARLMTLSEQMDTAQRELQSKQKELESATPANSMRLQKEMGQLQCKIGFLAAIRNSSFDEAYLTQAAYNRTCEGVTKRSPGQLGARDDDANLAIINKNRAQINSNNFQIISKPERREITVQEQALSPMEDHAKYLHKINAFEANAAILNDPKLEIILSQKGIIEGGKYAERVASAALAVAEEMHTDMQNTPKTISKLEGLLTKISTQSAVKESASLPNQSMQIQANKKELSQVDASQNKQVQAAKKELSQIEEMQKSAKPEQKYKLMQAKYNCIHTIAQSTMAMAKEASSKLKAGPEKQALDKNIETLQKQINLLADSPRLTKYLEEAESTYHITSQMESLKRKFNLNRETSAELLMNAFQGRKPPADPAKVNEVLMMFEPGGKLYGEELTPADKFNLAMGELEMRGLITTTVANDQELRTKKMKGFSDDVLLTSSNKAIDDVMKARAGFDRMADKDINKLHNDAQATTMKRLGLTDTAKINKYNDQLRGLSHKALLFSIKHGYLTPPPVMVTDPKKTTVAQSSPPSKKPTLTPNELSLTHVWDQVNKDLQKAQLAEMPQSSFVPIDL